MLSEIKTQFTGLMNRRDMTANTALTQTFIDQGIMRIQRELRVPAMEKSVIVTVATPWSGLVIPSDMIELIDLVNSQGVKLRKCDLTRATQLATVTGTPQEYCRQGGVWVLGNAPVAADTIRIDYYSELTPLVNPTDTNVMSVIAWDLIVNAALVQSCIYYKDKRAQDFETQYQTIKDALQDQSDEDDMGAGTEVMPAYLYPTDITDGDYGDSW